jgi:hypothetical protein
MGALSEVSIGLEAAVVRQPPSRSSWNRRRFPASGMRGARSSANGRSRCFQRCQYQGRTAEGRLAAPIAGRDRVLTSAAALAEGLAPAAGNASQAKLWLVLAVGRPVRRHPSFQRIITAIGGPARTGAVVCLISTCNLRQRRTLDSPAGPSRLTACLD